MNVTGDEPAATYEQALSFRNTYAPSAELIELKDLKPSGHSSTMVLLNEDLSWKIIREGEQVEHVKKSLELLTT